MFFCVLFLQVHTLTGAYSYRCILLQVHTLTGAYSYRCILLQVHTLTGAYSYNKPPTEKKPKAKTDPQPLKMTQAKLKTDPQPPYFETT
jgi:hypothetical protein